MTVTPYIKGRRLKGIEENDPKVIIGPKTNENGEWRMFHNKDVHNFCPSPKIVRVIASRCLNFKIRRTWRKNNVRYE